MSLNIGKFTGKLPDGSKIYQKIENEVQVITTTRKGIPVREIRLKKPAFDNVKGYFTSVKDLNSGVTRSFSDTVDYGFDEQFRVKSRRIEDASGNTRQVIVTTNKYGDTVEITNMQRKANGEEFWLSKNTARDNGTTEYITEFETSGFGWTKPNGEHINGFARKIDEVKDGKYIEGEKYGFMDSIPDLKDLS